MAGIRIAVVDYCILLYRHAFQVCVTLIPHYKQSIKYTHFVKLMVNIRCLKPLVPVNILITLASGGKAIHPPLLDV